jgi:hypothetical protein
MGLVQENRKKDTINEGIKMSLYLDPCHEEVSAVETVLHTTAQRTAMLLASCSSHCAYEEGAHGRHWRVCECDGKGKNVLLLGIEPQSSNSKESLY